MNKNQQFNLNDSVISDKLSEIVIEFIDVGIDQVINNGLLKDIPIFGIGYNVFEIARNITEQFFLKKVLLFLYQIKDIPQGKREKFVKELENENQSNRVGEKLLNYINRLDDINKAEIIGKLYKALIQKNISQSDFFRLTSYVDKSFIDDLMILKDFEYLQSEYKEIYESLSQVGLFSRRIRDNRDSEEYMNNKFGSSKRIAPSFEYEINKYGQLLIKYGLSD